MSVNFVFEFQTNLKIDPPHNNMSYAAVLKYIQGQEVFCLFWVKVLSSEMDLAEIRFIRKAFLKFVSK